MDRIQGRVNWIPTAALPVVALLACRSEEPLRAAGITAEEYWAFIANTQDFVKSDHRNTPRLVFLNVADQGHRRHHVGDWHRLNNTLVRC